MNENSKTAYHNIKPRLGLIQEQIMSHLPDIYCYTFEADTSYIFSKKFYPERTWFIKGAGTCLAIGYFAGMSEEQVRKRMSELERMGLVEKCEEKYSYKGSDGKTYRKSIYRAK